MKSKSLNSNKSITGHSIPSDWEEKVLKSITKKIVVGIATEVRPHVRTTGIPIIRNQNIRENYFDESEIIYISEEFDRANKNKRVKKDDILIVRTGSNIGQACIVPHQFDCAQTFTTLIVRTDSQLDPQYLSLHINSFGVQEVERLSAGGGKPNLNAGFLKQYRILLPPITEQRAIAHIISLVDTSINKSKLLIVKKELQKKWLMQNLLTGKKRLTGFSGAWQQIQLGDFIKESRIPSINNAVEKRITVKLNLKGIEVREVRGSEAEDATYFFKRKAGQFIYGKQNLHKGAFGIIPKELDGYESSQDLPAFDFIGNINANFFLLFLSQENTFQSLERISTGTGSKRIHPEELYKVSYNWPLLEEQTAITKVLQTADNEIQLIKNRADKLKEEKKGLIQQLMSGKQRLKI